MKLNTKIFSRELDFIARFAPTKTTIPILGNVSLTASGNKLSLCATDLETMGFSHVVGADSESWTGTVPAKKLAAYMKKVKEPEVTLTWGENHWLTVTHGANSVEFPGMSALSFPEAPGMPKLLFEFVAPEKVIPQVSIAISKDESRFSLNGALLHIAQATGDSPDLVANLVATDGHRLSKTAVSVTPIPGAELVPSRYLIPVKALKELQRLDSGRVWMGAGEDYISFVTARRAILARKLKGNFPDYERVMPKEFAHKIVLDSSVLAQAVDRAKLFADARSGAVLFSTGDGTLSIRAQGVETGNGAGTIAALGAEPGFSIGFNCKYVLDFLAVTKDQAVTFSYSDPTKAATFAGANGGAEYLVMPMRM